MPCGGDFAGRRLSHNGRRTFFHLTDAARGVAENIYERRCFFTEQLSVAGVDPKIAEADARRIEHVICNESFSRLKEAADR